MTPEVVVAATDPWWLSYVKDALAVIWPLALSALGIAGTIALNELRKRTGIEVTSAAAESVVRSIDAGIRQHIINSGGVKLLPPIPNDTELAAAAAPLQPEEVDAIVATVKRDNAPNVALAKETDESIAKKVDARVVAARADLADDMARIQSVAR